MLLAGMLFVFVPESWLRRGWNWSIGRFFRHTVESRLRQFGPAALARLELGFIPEKLDIIALKEERILELWGSRGSGKPELLKSYPVLAASGTAGPKLKEGDRQVPEGFYSIDDFNYMGETLSIEEFTSPQNDIDMNVKIHSFYVGRTDDCGS